MFQEKEASGGQGLVPAPICFLAGLDDWLALAATTRLPTDHNGPDGCNLSPGVRSGLKLYVLQAGIGGFSTFDNCAGFFVGSIRF